MAKPQQPEAAPADEEKPAGKSFPMKLMVIIGALMLVEAVGFVLLAPSIASSKTDEADKIEDRADQDKERAASEADQEIEIGAFNVTNCVALPETALQMTFHVHVQVPPDMVAEMQQRLEPRRNRVEQAIEIIARRASYKDLEDASLQLVKKRIREQVNEILGNKYVTEVIVRKFRQFGG